MIMEIFEVNYFSYQLILIHLNNHPILFILKILFNYFLKMAFYLA